MFFASKVIFSSHPGSKLKRSNYSYDVNSKGYIRDQKSVQTRINKNIYFAFLT